MIEGAGEKRAIGKIPGIGATSYEVTIGAEAPLTL